MNENIRISVSERLPDHSKYVEIGKTYDFNSVCIRQVSSGINLIQMEYVTPEGDVIPLFGVKPYPFQEEGGLTPKIRCFVKGFFNTGLARLAQDNEWLLNLLYKDSKGDVGSFTVEEVLTDKNTAATYYRLRDVFGVDFHRYYPEQDAPRFEVGQQIELAIKDIHTKYIELVEPKDIATEENKTFVAGRFGKEDATTEFKTSIVYNAGTHGVDPDTQLGVITKEIAAFLNAEGGTVYIGVDDHGNLRGIADDMPHLNEGDNDGYNGSYKPTPDGYELKIRNAIKRMLGNTANGQCTVQMLEEEGLIYCKIDIQPCPDPVYWRGDHLYQRAGNQKQRLKGSEITSFIKLRLADQIKEYISKGPVFGTIVHSAREIAPLNPISPVSESNEVWYHFTWYNNGEFSFQKESIENDEVKLQIMISKGCESERLVFCYANGRVNMVVPSKIRAGKNVRKRYKLGFNNKSELLAAFPARNYDLVAVLSANAVGQQFVKAHHLTDFTPTESMASQGSNIIPTNNSQGAVVKFVKLDVGERNIIPNLVFQRNQTTTSIGVDINDVRYVEEVRHLLCRMA